MFVQHYIEPGQIWKCKSKNRIIYVEILNYFHYNEYIKDNDKYYFYFKKTLRYRTMFSIEKYYQLVTNPKKLDNIKRIIQEIKFAEL